MLSDLLTRLIRPMLSRPVTSDYPRSPIGLPSNARGLPVVDASRCDQTAACVTVCPTGAIALEGREAQADLVGGCRWLHPLSGV